MKGWIVVPIAKGQKLKDAMIYASRAGARIYVEKKTAEAESELYLKAIPDKTVKCKIVKADTEKSIIKKDTSIKISTTKNRLKRERKRSI